MIQTSDVRPYRHLPLTIVLAQHALRVQKSGRGGRTPGECSTLGGSANTVPSRMTSADPEPVYDELFEPLALALGRLVVGAAVLESTLRLGLIQRKVRRDGPEEVFGNQVVSQLDRLPAGALLKLLLEIGFEEDLAEEIAEVIRGRNLFVHHLFEDPEFIKAFATQGGVDQIVERVESLTEGIYSLVKRLEGETISGAEAMFGRSGPELLQAIKQIDLTEIDDDGLRKQIEALQVVPGKLVEP